MNLNDFLTRLANEPQNIAFTDTMTVIDNNYTFTPSGFNNHGLLSGANENNGSCKIFAFAKLNQLSKQNTLDCFGAFYREDVLGNPNGEDHMNIRTFMLAPEATPFLGITFDEGQVLTSKN
ncbi:HopJ type III effector protein [Pseudoalteromonas shioyasakiensis]|uniref:HopJ type III effector protein n=1 Tax=Pseudoalteromonas shioyasakiensis TaxID=1190813 RepID=UPI002118F32F|nr:HopJ type III effector protein [Pseudoalteromonas shioyasakiensis]MCQ8879621.1 HopJ type III effector protein [Pseudoalteromonas shioyasakiensis]